MKTAAAYIRVSTDSQTEYSPDSQIRLIRDYAKRNGILLLDEFIYADEGISGREANKRPSFQKMLYAAKNKQFNVILIYHTSRFARNHEESVVYRSMLKREGVEVLSITQPNIDEKTDLLMNALYAVMDERYSLDLSENVLRGMTEKAMRGECVSSVPFGYVMADGVPKIQPDSSEIVKNIFDDYLNKNIPAYRIARNLNDMGVPSPRGKRWERGRIDSILTNPFYCGYIRWNQYDKRKVKKDNAEWVIRRGNQPILIPEETHKAVIAKMSKNRALPNKQNTKMAHWLTGLVRCSACGFALNVVRSTTKGNPPYLRCRAYMAGKCAVTQYVRASKLEAYLKDSLQQVAQFPGKCQFEEPAKHDFEKEIANIKKAIERADIKLKRVKEAYENEIDTLEEYKANKIKITAEISELKQKLSDIDTNKTRSLTKSQEKKFISSIKDLTDLLFSDDTTAEQKYSAVRAVISKIIWDKHNKTFEVFYFMP